jgi:hypothetical protein
MKMASKKIILALFFIVLYTANIFAEDNRIIPILNYEFFSVERQKYHLPGGGGLIFLKGNYSSAWEEKPDNLMIGLFYKPFILKEIMAGYSELYHDFDFIVEKKIDSHLFQGIFSTFSDKPIYGGFQTIYTSIGYGYELIRRENLNFTLGFALGVGDFGINMPNGNIWPVLPMPIIRLNFESSTINFSLDFPEFKLVFLPESKIRMTGTGHMDIYKFHDIHDFKFNSILWYRFFDKDFTAGDFLGIGLGIQNIGQNDGTDFILGEKPRKYDMNYYSVFGILDAGLLKISSGYIFYSREVYDASNSKPTGKGWFISVQALYQF